MSSRSRWVKYSHTVSQRKELDVNTHTPAEVIKAHSG
jgi:hypothetical protein